MPQRSEEGPLRHDIVDDVAEDLPALVARALERVLEQLQRTLVLPTTAAHQPRSPGRPQRHSELLRECVDRGRPGGNCINRPRLSLEAWQEVLPDASLGTRGKSPWNIWKEPSRQLTNTRTKHA